VLAIASGGAAGTRVAYLDNLKVGMIATIIAAHGVNGYADFGSWAYRDLREVSLSPPAETVFTVALTIPALFVMGLFFLISGLLTPGAVDRKGPGRFARDRLVRLGIPLAVFTLALWPGTIWIARSLVLGPGSFRQTLAEMDPFLDNGPMWFVFVLLLYSLAYAVLRRWRPAPQTHDVDLRARQLVLLGLAIAAGSFIVRLAFPVNSGQPLNIHLWEWPQCVGMFGLGIVCARHAWLRPVPDRLSRYCGWLALVAALSLPVMVLTAEGLGLTDDDYFGGWGWPSLLTVTAEAVLVICASIWILGAAQRHMDREGPFLRGLARSSYAAFIVQAPVLMGLALALRSLEAPAEAKALAVAIVGVAFSFALGWVIATRTPLRTIL
jgi:fucose 4-O-acetylase-like acetyltransferase